jgi:hypothetical protein
MLKFLLRRTDPTKICKSVAWLRLILISTVGNDHGEYLSDSNIHEYTCTRSLDPEVGTNRDLDNCASLYSYPSTC